MTFGECGAFSLEWIVGRSEAPGADRPAFCEEGEETLLPALSPSDVVAFCIPGIASLFPLLLFFLLPPSLPPPRYGGNSTKYCCFFSSKRVSKVRKVLFVFCFHVEQILSFGHFERKRRAKRGGREVELQGQQFLFAKMQPARQAKREREIVIERKSRQVPSSFSADQ